jgi:hypothetical protein
MKKITTFWNWFQKNEHEIIKALILGINKEDVISQMLKKLDYVSKRIGFVIKPPRKFKDNFIIIFTGSGYPKLFAKIIALKNQAPTLKHFTVQAFIKPSEDITMYKEGTDEPCECKNFKIKISEFQMALLDYNIATKQLKIDLYLPDYNELKQYNDLKSSIELHCNADYRRNGLSQAHQGNQFTPDAIGAKRPVAPHGTSRFH